MVKALWTLTALTMLLGFCALPAQAQEATRVEQAVAFLAANGIPSAAYTELSTALSTNDYRNVSAVLVKHGYTPDQLKAFISDTNLLLLRAAINPGIADDILIEGLALAQSYGLDALDLQWLTALMDDPMAMAGYLTGQGLTPEQVARFLNEAAILLEGTSQYRLQYHAINGLLVTFIDDAGLPMAMLYDSAHLLDDPAAAVAYLTGIGYPDEQAQAFVALLPELAARGATPDVVEGWTVGSMIYRLEGIGLPLQSIYEVVALGNLDAVRGYLIAKGLSGDVLELALVNIGGCMGAQGEALNPERLAAFQVREASALLGSAGITPSNLRIILALNNHPAALGDYLASTYGLDQAQIDSFILNLSQSTFARTVDPDDAENSIFTLIAAR